MVQRLMATMTNTDVVAFLLSDSASYLAMQDVVVDGGAALGA